MSHKIEIVTPVHNRVIETLQCLRSIERLEKTGLDLHVIVVDDDSTDGTVEALAGEFPDVEVIKGDGSLWYTAGTNRGIKAAMRHKPDFILAINNDSIFDEKCVLKMVECAEKHPRSVVGAVLLDWQSPHKLFQVSPRWELWKGGYRHWYKQTIWTIPNRPWEVELIVGNCVMYPAKAIEEVGFMDEKHLPQYGDAEYTPRMRRSGWRLIIEPQARVFCKTNDDISGFRKLAWRQQLDRLLLDSTSPYSLRRRFYASLGGAPDRLQALLAIPVSIARILVGRSYESSYALTRDEPPITETFALAVIND